MNIHKLTNAMAVVLQREMEELKRTVKDCPFHPHVEANDDFIIVAFLRPMSRITVECCQKSVARLCVNFLTEK